MRKRFIGIIAIAVCMILVLASCGQTANSTTAQAETTVAVETVAETTVEATTESQVVGSQTVTGQVDFGVGDPCDVTLTFDETTWHADFLFKPRNENLSMGGTISADGFVCVEDSSGGFGGKLSEHIYEQLYLPNAGGTVSKGLEANLSADKYDGKEVVDFTKTPEGFQAVTVGSGSPLMSVYRSGPCTLIQYKDKYFMVDCGYGSCQTLYELGLDISDIRTLIITHQHEDHNADYDHFLMQGWYNADNQRKSLNIVGPMTQMQYDNAIELYAEDIAGREAIGTLSMDGIRDKVTIYDVAGDTYSVVIDDVQIDMIKVPHGNMTAYSVKFTADGKTVIVTGDLAYQDNLTEFLKDADLVIADGATATGYFAELGEEIIKEQMYGTHILMSELAKVATDANVKKLVLTHVLIDFKDYEETKKLFTEAGFKGELFAAYDGLAVQP